MTVFKKRFSTLLICGAVVMMSALQASAQIPDNATVLLHYKFTWVRDTSNRARPYTENMVLSAGHHAALYKSNDEHKSDAQYYQFPNEKKMLRRENIIMFKYLIQEELPAINWRVANDTASFGGLHCQKATAHFQGRDYTAWFCPDLPLHAGPWKLNGLPGTIVEAYDSKREVIFHFDRIEKPTTPFEIAIPKDGTPTTEKEFARLQETFRKDPDAFLKMIAGQGDGSGRTLKIDIKPGPGPVINNPIELPENK